jgi:hypothetical protein
MIDKELEQNLNDAFQLAHSQNHEFVTVEHLLLSLLDNSDALDLLQSNNIKTDTYEIIEQSQLTDTLKAVVNTFKPNLVILGHADGVSKKTLLEIKKLDKNVKFTQWFLDPVTKYGPDYHKNKYRILHKSKIVDTTFVTTHPNAIDFKIKNTYFLPNPCDESLEVLKNYNHKCSKDVFFGMSHGVHRGTLKEGKVDNRELFINKLIRNCEDVKFDIYGMNNVQPVWGSKFIKTIANSKMGLNLSRGEPVKYYSSDRIVQLIGNGLLTFIDKKTKLNDLISTKEAVFYNNMEDLIKKIKIFKKNDKRRIRIARAGRNMYHKYFNSTLVANYIVDRTLGIKSKYYWEK